MLENHLARISSASEALASSIREYSAALSVFRDEVEAHYNSGLPNDRLMLRKLASAVDGPLETTASHTSRLQLVQTSLQKTKNKMIPVNSLHPELLARVFTLFSDGDACNSQIEVFGSYLADSSDIGRYEKRSSLIRTLVVSGVCGYWRHIALSVGSLWTCIHVYPAGKEAKRSLASALVWLKRARTTPLDVSIDMQEIMDTSSNKRMLDKVLALPFSNKQICSLYLSPSTTNYLNDLLYTCFSDGVSFTLTKLYVDIVGITDEVSILQDWLSRCQELQVLQLSVEALNGNHFPVLPKLVELWLFTTNLNPLTIEQFTNILRACPSLQRLNLRSLELENTTGSSFAPIPLLQLSTLVLQYVNPSSYIPLFFSTSSSFDLSITIDDFDLWGHNLADHLRVFSSRAAITKLHLETNPDTWEDIHHLLRLLPHLRTLSLQDTTLNNSMASALRGTSELDTDESAPSTFPALQAIWLTKCEIAEEEVLRLLVDLRPLQQLKLHNCRFSPVGPITQANELCEYLLGAVSDLEVTNYDNGKIAYFP